MRFSKLPISLIATTVVVSVAFIGVLLVFKQDSVFDNVASSMAALSSMMPKTGSASQSVSPSFEDIHQLPPGSLSPGTGTSSVVKGKENQLSPYNSLATVFHDQSMIVIGITIVAGGLSVIVLYLFSNSSPLSTTTRPGVIASGWRLFKSRVGGLLSYINEFNILNSGPVPIYLTALAIFCCLFYVAYYHTNVPSEGKPTNVPSEGKPTNVPSEGTPTNVTSGEGTPTNVTSGDTPTNVTSGDTPTNVTSGDTPTNVTSGDTPTNVPSEGKPTNVPSEGKPTGEGTPTNVTSGDTPTNVTSGDTPTNVTSGDTPTNVTSGDTPTNVTSGDTPTNVPSEGKPTNVPSEGKPTGEGTPTNVTSGDTPTNVTSGDTPTNVTSGDTPTNVTSGDTPTNVTSGDTPTNVTSEGKPTNVTSGDTPTNVTSGDTWPITAITIMEYSFSPFRLISIPLLEYAFGANVTKDYQDKFFDAICCSLTGMLFLFSATSLQAIAIGVWTLGFVAVLLTGLSESPNGPAVAKYLYEYPGYVASSPFAIVTVSFSTLVCNKFSNWLRNKYPRISSYLSILMSLIVASIFNSLYQWIPEKLFSWWRTNQNNMFNSLNDN